MTRPITKLSVLRSAWERGDRLEALRIAARFADLGAHKDAIRRGWDAVQRPAFYKQLRKDPAALTEAAFMALAERYGLEVING